MESGALVLVWSKPNVKPVYFTLLSGYKNHIYTKTSKIWAQSHIQELNKTKNKQEMKQNDGTLREKLSATEG